MRYYAGLGSRKAPLQHQKSMTNLAQLFSKLGFTLRSGAAPGPDTWFEEGAGNLAEIWVPWPGFERDSKSDLYYVPQEPYLSQAITLISTLHPAWDKCTPGARLLHARNMFQIYGSDLKTPVEFAIIYGIPDGTNRIKGGTNTAYQLCLKANIPVYNVYHGYEKVDELISTLKIKE